MYKDRVILKKGNPLIKRVMTMLLLLISVVCILSGCTPKEQVPEQPTPGQQATKQPTPEQNDPGLPADKGSYQASFDQDAEGFEAIFADYERNSEGLDKYEMSSSYANIPVSGAESYGLQIASHNRSDDIFMGYVKELSGFAAGTKYSFTINFQLATSIEGGLMGVGGSPGESVFVKAGIASEYPVVGTAEDGVERILNVDTGIQSQDGTDLVVIGTLTKPDESPEGFVFKEMQVECTATANADGKLYLIIGTDSGFEGYTEYYLDNIRVSYQR